MSKMMKIFGTVAKNVPLVSKTMRLCIFNFGLLPLLLNHLNNELCSIQVDQLFGVSKTNTDRLWMGISDGVVTSESYDKPTDDFSNLKPMLSIISDKTLSRSMDFSN